MLEAVNTPILELSSGITDTVSRSSDHRCRHGIPHFSCYTCKQLGFPPAEPDLAVYPSSYADLDTNRVSGHNIRA